MEGEVRGGSWCSSIVGTIALRRLHKFPVFAKGVGARAGCLQVVPLSCEAISKVKGARGG